MNLKKLPVAYLFIAFAFFSCEEDKDEMDEVTASGNPVGIVENAHASGQTVSADFTGRIFDKNGNPISGASVSAGGSLTQSNAQGFYQIEDAAVDGDYALIKVEHDGMFDQYRALKPKTSRTNYVDIAMIQKVVNGFFSTSSGGVINIPGGATVAFPAGELVTSNGQPYTGEVLVASTYLDPSDSRLMSYMPGSLAAVDDDGEAVGMVTYGMVGIELTAASNGQSLQLAGGRTATLTMPLPETHTSHAPESIPLWYFDETAGIWQEDGVATRSGNSYVGQVSHFTFWNCDVSTNTLVLEGTVIASPTGFPFSDMRVKLTRPNESFALSNISADGYFSGIVPADEVLILELISSDCETIFYESQVGPFSEDTDLGDIEVEISELDFDLISISGTIVDCEGIPMDGVFLSFDQLGGGVNGYLVTDETGSYSTIITCVDQGTLLFTPTSLSELISGEALTLSYDITESQDYDLGETPFCDGVAIVEYLNYSDGTNELNFNTVEIFNEGEECDVLFATKSGSETTDYTENIGLFSFGAQDSLDIWFACSQDIVIRGYLSNGNYLVADIAAGETELDIIQQIADGDSELLEANMQYGMAFSGTVTEVTIYEDDGATTPLNTYQPDEVNIDFLVIYEN